MCNVCLFVYERQTEKCQPNSKKTACEYLFIEQYEQNWLLPTSVVNK